MEGFDWTAIGLAALTAVGAIAAVWIGKGFKAIERVVEASSNQIDDKALEIIKNGLREALKEDPPAP